MIRRCKRERLTAARLLLWQGWDAASHLKCRERLIERNVHQPSHRGRVKPRRIAIFDAERGRLLLGHGTQHRTKAARLWRCRLRLKNVHRAQSKA
jgi:hypothetical protein